MPRQIVIHPPPPANRRQPLLVTQSSTGSVRFAEVAGGTTAECAAVCCCCPCTLVNLFVLALYKVPAGLCRRALRRNRRKRMIKKGLLPTRHRRCSCGWDDAELQIHPVPCQEMMSPVKLAKLDESEEVLALEKEMWDRFYGTGFWRSPSQRETHNAKKL